MLYHFLRWELGELPFTKQPLLTVCTIQAPWEGCKCLFCFLFVSHWFNQLHFRRNDSGWSQQWLISRSGLRESHFLHQGTSWIYSRQHTALLYINMSMCSPHPFPSLEKLLWALTQFPFSFYFLHKTASFQREHSNRHMGIYRHSPS